MKTNSADERRVGEVERVTQASLSSTTARIFARMRPRQSDMSLRVLADAAVLAVCWTLSRSSAGVGVVGVGGGRGETGSVECPRVATVVDCIATN